MFASWFAAALLAACDGSGGQAVTSQDVAGAGGAAAPPSAGVSGGVAGSSGAAGTAGAAAGSGGSVSAGAAGGGAAQAGNTGTIAGSGGAGSGGVAAAGAGSAAGASAAGSGGAAGAGGAAGGPSGPPSPDPKFLVPATGPCPEFRDGYAMFAPDGKQRRVLLYAAPKPDLHGPLIISWHSTLPNPEDAVAWIGQSVINEIKAQGGIVAAPATADPTSTRPWDNTPMGPRNTDSDQRLMDEIVACAVSKVGIDVRRIHATGMSAGGLKTAQVSLRRSGYLASVVVYSGGLTAGD
ncbi:MAG TPA: hypothetical protein VFG30_15835, partial [Polyangiales bacterium]|nr:hypothetical protein [Polyangiales bacterium]